MLLLSVNTVVITDSPKKIKCYCWSLERSVRREEKSVGNSKVMKYSVVKDETGGEDNGRFRLPTEEQGLSIYAKDEMLEDAITPKCYIWLLNARKGIRMEF